ncbi:MAG TPA: hypothetical protein PLK46_04630 [Propioniciclava sp.]|uniref:hypothetical protein n=1 Tax=Propioniciclava sp. TaxID=2038686 RepID=UPI002C7518EB|nr:hypothetical protein [Propioniciclava sp.]HRL48037.1 hypothetical protein [Propioniciclava sp.]HRL79605.1 hypothetical protein [Propioniciclava sp.]
MSSSGLRRRGIHVITSHTRPGPQSGFLRPESGGGAAPGEVGVGAAVEVVEPVGAEPLLEIVAVPGDLPSVLVASGEQRKGHRLGEPEQPQHDLLAANQLR